MLGIDWKYFNLIKKQLTPEFEKILDDHITKYFELLKNMNDHPEWKEKVFYLIYRLEMNVDTNCI